MVQSATNSTGNTSNPLSQASPQGGMVLESTEEAGSHDRDDSYYDQSAQFSSQEEPSESYRLQEIFNRIPVSNSLLEALFPARAEFGTVEQTGTRNSNSEDNVRTLT